MRTCRIYALARSLLGILAFGAVPTLLYADKDVGGYIWNLSSHTDDSYDTFHFKGGSVGSYGLSTFEQNYRNGTLIVGNTSKTPANRDLGVHFGVGGKSGYISGTWNAKEVYLTAYLGAGNAEKTAGADLTFNATGDITAEGLIVDMWSDTQADRLILRSSGGNITLKDSDFKIHGADVLRGESALTLEAKNMLSADNFKLNMPTSTARVNATFKAGEISFTNSNLNIEASSTSGAVSTTKFQADKNISFDDKTTANFRADHFEMTAGENIALNGTTNMQSGGNTTDAYTSFTAGKNLSLNTLNATLHSGKGQFIAKAGESIKIQNLDLHSNLGTAVNVTTATLEAKSITLDRANIYNTKDTALNAGGFHLKMHATDGDITIGKDSSTQNKLSADHLELSGQNLYLKGSTSIESGTLTIDTYINFTADKNIAIDTLNTTLFSGKGNMNLKAGENLSIKNLTLHGNLGLAVNKTHATFEANTINLDKAEIYSTRGITNKTDNAGAFVVKFVAKDSITLKDTNIKLTNQLEDVGAPDYAVFESGGDLTHTGKLSTATAQQTWGGATFDFSKVKGKASVGDIEIVAANVKMNKDFTAKSLVVQKRQTNGGQGGLGTRFWTQESGKYKFDSIALNDGTDLAADTARMTFVNSEDNNAFVKDSKLELGSLSVGVKGGFYASNIHHTTATNITLHSNSTASFHHLTLTPGGQIVMDATNAQLVLDNQLVNGKNEAGVLELGV
ncbi:vacuolating cytotoxin domain-containing protein, partial [uncultured Helicobacter sp.]|uniref:vacuolating cytotoxin domain-containing protein n=1 Tax=uncultured Helicobacter sp. TaxID=175537 RepID=UPI00260AFCFB